jgi:peptidoglycan-associated lipoprotein
MYKHSFSRFALLGLLAVTVIGAGCAHHVPPVAPTPTATAPAPTPPARPTVTLQASSTFIQRGDSTTLTWSSTNATTLTLNPGSSVAPEGSQKVSPTDSTTYTITATGPGGTADQSIRITVSAAAPPVAADNTPSETPDEAFRRGMHDAYFDYNEAALRPDAKDGLSQSAQFLRQHPEINIIVEGYCDERGTTEYNLGLGQKRADAVKQFLESLGIPANRIATTSFGKEKPFCTEHTESCWQQNRRGHFVKAH